MKLKIFLLLLLFPLLTFAQTKGRIVYKIATEPPANAEENNSKRKNFISFMDSMSEIRDQLPFHLDFDKQESVFYVDTETNLGLSNKTGYEAVIKTFNFYYRNESTKTAIEQIHSERTYLVESKTSDIVWNITKEQKTIGEYLCFKATASVSAYLSTRGIYDKTIEAWFTPNIALALGPKNYGGLPGLIMELTDGKFTYYVNSIDFNPEFDLEVKKPTKGKTIDREEYFNMQPTITKDNFKQYIGG